MKKTIIISTAIILGFSSCGKSTPICECFENQLEIKSMLSSGKGDIQKIMDISKSEEYLKLQEKKKLCKDKTEPDFFKSIDRNGRNDQQFLLDELGGCGAVQELYGK